jgi:hypothetical protein
MSAKQGNGDEQEYEFEEGIDEDEEIRSSPKSLCRKKGPTVWLTADTFGQVVNPKSGTSETVKRYTWTNASGMTVQVRNNFHVCRPLETLIFDVYLF